VERALRLGEPFDGVVGEEADVVRRARQNPLRHGLVERAIVDGLHRREARDRLVDCVREPAERSLPPLRSERGPVRERSPRRGDRRVGLCRASACNVGELPAVPVDRATNLEGLGRVHAPPVDVVAGRHGHTLDIGSGGHR
jgi:hypothetical protein